MEINQSQLLHQFSFPHILSHRLLFLMFFLHYGLFFHVFLLEGILLPKHRKHVEALKFGLGFGCTAVPLVEPQTGLDQGRNASTRMRERK